MEYTLDTLKKIKPEKDFFIGIDSDGCVFDSMEVKHKECFCPATIKHFNLQKVAKYAREAWEFVNLYSTNRGANRFKALLREFELLADRPEIKARNAELIDLTPLREWVNKESKLGNPALKIYAAGVNDPVIDKVLAWSEEVNKVIHELVFDVPPFPFVRECLEIMVDKADLMVVSQTPIDALTREWEEHDINQFVKLIAGQEYGTKEEHLRYAAVGKYDPEKILMLGDAPGDYQAAKKNGVLFFPIIPGEEELSWQGLLNEGLAKFFDGTFAGDYQEKLLEEFMKHLPEKPKWRTISN